MFDALIAMRVANVEVMFGLLWLSGPLDRYSNIRSLCVVVAIVGRRAKRQEGWWVVRFTGQRHRWVKDGFGWSEIPVRGGVIRDASEREQWKGVVGEGGTH